MHFNKRMLDGRHADIFVMSAIDEILPNLDVVWPTAAASELDSPLWSVVSFERREAGGLTYDQAVVCLSELNADGVAGLCIITDKAAKNIQN